MLVLSRRPSEKILFPGIGISVEILETRGNTVRVGIEAPRDIRVLRDELVESADYKFESSRTIENGADKSVLDKKQQQSVCQRIDEISLAIVLAQNQRRQGLNDNVDNALEQAIDRLQELKLLMESTDQPEIESANNTLVCESKTEYNTTHETTSVIGEMPSVSRKQLSRRLAFELSLAD